MASRTILLLWLSVVILAASVEAAGPVSDYVGPGRCSQQNCHGAKEGRCDSETIRQDEYSIWSSRDHHRKAFSKLRSELSERIAARLGMTQPPTEAEQCLDCHTLGVPASPGVRPQDGVSCEACHGPARRWVKDHDKPGWTPKQSVALGMVDTRDPAKAAEQCLRCHLGTERRSVDHALLAAGHPPLVFELESFSTRMPPHWIEHDGNRGWFRGGAWVAGQAVAAREASKAFLRARGSAGWPEFSVYDCYACHHDLDRDQGWRVRGTGGLPPIDVSRWILLGRVAPVVAHGDAGALRAATARFLALARSGPGTPGLSAAANTLGATAEAVAAGSRNGYDAAAIDTMLAALTAGRGEGGFRTAQQTAWALDGFARAATAPVEPVRCRQPGDGPAEGTPLRTSKLDTAFDRLFGGLRTSTAYDPERFARDVAAIGRATGTSR